MKETQFVIGGKPVPASRPKVSKWGAYYPKTHVLRAEEIKKYLLSLPEFPTDEPVEVRILHVMQPYKTSDSLVHRADVDNLSKLPMDEMTKSCHPDGPSRFWVDDNQVVNLVALKRFAREGEEPHTKVRIIKLGADYGDHVDQVFSA